MLQLCLFSASFLITYFGVRLFRGWTVKRGVLDTPNERSSHEVPTPRGGGLVIALVVLATYLTASFLVPFDTNWGFVSGSVMIVLISWLDDMYSISFLLRLIVHAVAAATIIATNGYVSQVIFPGQNEPLYMGWFGAAASFAWIVWLVNAYNFMDGIDGIAGLQAVAAGLAWVIIGTNFDAPSTLIIAGATLFASFAFLLHNWPPARIFMGDAGSAFLGYVFACLPFVLRRETGTNGGYFLLAGVLFVWLFVFDSVLTLIRRALRGDRVWTAHREHLYQRLVVSGYSHRSVSLFYGIFSLCLAVLTAIAISEASLLLTVVAVFAAIAASLVIVFVCWRRHCLVDPSG